MSDKKNFGDGWIRKESKSKPNQYYLFNTKTGESQWEKSPTTDGLKKTELQSKEKKIENKTMTLKTQRKPLPKKEEKNISANAREVQIHKFTTAAQDRLKNIIKKNDVVTQTIKADVSRKPQQTNKQNENSTKTGDWATITQTAKEKEKKNAITVPVATFNKINQSNSVLNRNATNKHKLKSTFVPSNNNAFKIKFNNNKIAKNKKAPAQERLKNLQQKLINDASELVKKSVNSRIAKAPSKPINTESAEPKLSFEKTEVTDVCQVNSNIPLDNEEIDNSWPKIQPLMVNDNRTTFDANKESNLNSANSIPDQGEQMDWEQSFSLPVPENVPKKLKTVDSSESKDAEHRAYIVPDTNIFLSALICVKDITTTDSKYHVVIPFMVLQELDKLKNKENDTVSQMASRAIKYIYENLKVDNERIQGQSAKDDKEVLIDITSPDDKILNCCLQLKERSNQVTLLTNDINLSNKAMSSGITTITSRKCNEMYEK